MLQPVTILYTQTPLLNIHSQHNTSSLRLRFLPLILRKPQTNTINTMPLIRRCRIPLSLEHMPQMPSTVIAHDLRALHPKRRIRVPLHSPRHGVEIRRPAAAGLELVRGRVQRRRAPRARVHALRGVVRVVFACEGAFGAFFAEDAELVCLFVN